MWESPPIDQADAYGKDELSKAKLTEVEKFHLLEGISGGLLENHSDGVFYVFEKSKLRGLLFEVYSGPIKDVA
jgi:hypothetical protein